ncbi:NmrA/HSCARG family protein [Aspergillus stella-maris]|uniref:NmrA/HSCARG family protein n=1 Tax=Aspergillus stella-maris TaxID=1810926 RepID=UPI003CCDB8A8
MDGKKLIVILGATGNQGGSVIGTFLSDKTWRARGITRNASSTPAQALADKGVEMVEADLDEPASLDAAFEDASVIFSVTDFWNNYFDPSLREKKPADIPMNESTHSYEIQQGKNVFDAVAKVPTLERLIFSSLSNATKWSKGKYPNVLHFTSKALAVEYGKEKYPELWGKTSVYQAGWYISNFLNNPMSENGIYHFISGIDGDTYLPFITADEDTGPAVRALVLSPPGKNLIAYREWITPNEFAEIWSRTLGVAGNWLKLPDGQTISGIPEDLENELSDNFAYFNEFGYEGRDDPTLIHPHQLEIKFQLSSVEEWIKKQDWSAVLSDGTRRGNIRMY